MPPVGSSSFMMQRAIVDLPHPDSPTTPSVSPSRSAKETPSTAFTDATSFWKTMPRVIGKCFFRLLDDEELVAAQVESRRRAAACSGAASH